MKKVILMVLVCAICMTFCGNFAVFSATEMDDLIQNGSFELKDDNGIPKIWGFKKDGTNLKEGYAVVENKEDGGSAIELKSVEQSLSFNQKIKDIIPETKYTVDMSVKAVSSKNFAVKIEAYGQGNVVLGSKEYKPTLRDREEGWQNVRFDYTLPAETIHAYLHIRLLGAGEVVVDNVQMLGKMVLPVQPGELVETLPGAKSIITNSSFDEVSDGAAVGWKPYKGSWDGMVQIAKDTERGNVLQLRDEAGKSAPWGMFLLQDLVPDSVYQLHAFVRTSKDTTGVPVYKIEFYSGREVAAGTNVGYKDARFLATRGYWQEVSTTFRVPKGAQTAAIYCRLSGAGEACFDDVTCTMVTEPRRMRIGSDAFVYSDWEQARGYVELSPEIYPINDGDKVQFQLCDGTVVLDTFETKAELCTEYFFPTTLLAELKKEYTIRATYMDGTGAVLDTREEPIYKYNRPTLLNENGEFIGTDGKPILPYFAYHAHVDAFPRLKELGVNVVQFSEGNDGAGFLEALDIAQEHGIYLALNLYAYMKPAGNPVNVERTKRVVEQTKNHPALFGYMVMDEPYGNDKEIYEDLRASYKLLRDMDDKHPVYICECEVEWEYKVLSVCDVLAVDPYPGSKNNKDGKWYTYVSDFVRATENVNLHNKPVFSIIQGWEYNGYLPDANGFRHLSYQALFTGSQYLGVYPIKEGEEYIWDLPLYDGFSSIVQDEYAEAYKVFCTNEYKTFSEVSLDSRDVWYKCYIKDNDLYIIVLNRTTEAQQVQIPLLSGGVRIGAFQVTAADISGSAPFNGDGTLSFELPATAVVKYKIEPAVTPDFSQLGADTFSDIENYDWARETINRLASMGIINDFEGLFKPGISITRGDFAMWLVKTLGVKANGTPENFADVAEDAEYAKYVAIGKAAGILKGTDGVNFYPETPISRQDLMTIIGRAMQLTDEADLSAFTDSAAVADYALPHVRAMIAKGLVKGNADGTLNPLGNTTRAEAAVIMNRILEQ